MERVTEALAYETAIRTDTGLVRRSNQDSAGSDEAAGLYVVCDGMGGVAGGEVASRIAVDTFLHVGAAELSIAGSACGGAEHALRRAVCAANRAVIARAAFDTCFRGMGTTLVGLHVDGSTCRIIHVGDSRAYLVREDRAVRLTQDHSFVAEQVQCGLMTPEEAAGSSLQSLITRAIGAATDVNPDLFAQNLIPGDAVLLCSDGLTRHVSDEEIGGAFAAHLAEGAGAVCDALIEAARWRGGSDNITCLIVVLGEGATRPI